MDHMTGKKASRYVAARLQYRFITDVLCEVARGISSSSSHHSQYRTATRFEALCQSPALFSATTILHHTCATFMEQVAAVPKSQTGVGSTEGVAPSTRENQCCGWQHMPFRYRQSAFRILLLFCRLARPFHRRHIVSVSLDADRACGYPLTTPAATLRTRAMKRKQRSRSLLPFRGRPPKQHEPIQASKPPQGAHNQKLE